MEEITKKELLSLAHLSRLHLDEAEIPGLIKQIQDVLNYSQGVKKAAQLGSGKELRAKNINVVREDVTQEQHPEPILAQAPEREQDFFVVPVIIEK